MVVWIMKCVTTVAFSICINSERHGYFKRGRGLRQGDPMSPYLFILVMELLTLIIQRRIRNTGIIKDALNEFSDVSSLFPNLNKSFIFFGSMNNVEKQRIVEVMQFQEGTLPTKNGHTAKGRAKVAWKHICKPKKKGGLGIKDLETWNDALLSKHSDSWNWKCLLKIRDKMADKIQYEVGDGRNICMCEFEVMEIRPPRLQTGMIDKVIWKGKDNTLVPFNTKLVMDALSQNYEKS
ncbi:hypothetical protein Tco_1042300 [Tanacetum coccineum]|uniref:Reverse transcriptase domain-containing protein n=1 Tax=Tanacetum coccineum TaxID=301880 RepID=A0ABQ5GIQ5_9ASTR